MEQLQVSNRHHHSFPARWCATFTPFDLYNAVQYSWGWGEYLFLRMPATISLLRGDKPAKSAILMNREQSTVWFPALGFKHTDETRKKNCTYLSSGMMNWQMIILQRRGTYMKNHFVSVKKNLPRKKKRFNLQRNYALMRNFKII